MSRKSSKGPKKCEFLTFSSKNSKKKIWKYPKKCDTFRNWLQIGRKSDKHTPFRQILHEKIGMPATARASIGLYNTKEDIDILLNAIEKCKKVFKI